MKKMKYKVGDNVVIRSEGFFKALLDPDGIAFNPNNWHDQPFISEMLENCGKSTTVLRIVDGEYRLEGCSGWYVDWMLENADELNSK